jgi:hypothetical protein
MVGSVPGALIRTAFAPAIFKISSLWILSSSVASMTDDEMELLLLLADGAAEQATELLARSCWRCDGASTLFC